MKKKKIAILVITLVSVILLFPIRMNLKDGGSVSYRSLVYEVTKIHQLAPEGGAVKPYIDGFEVKILGLTVYRKTDEFETVVLHDEIFDETDWSQEPTDADEIITYSGKEYRKSELSNATLKWLELSEQERLFSSYLPPEFMSFEETWGIALTAEHVTETSAIIKCSQSGGEPTGELHTGSWYIVESWTQEHGWKEMPYVVDGKIGWNDIAWIIPMEGQVEWEVNWEWLYGKLPVGKYRIGKEITDFRDTGDYDQAVYYAEFTIGNGETAGDELPDEEAFVVTNIFTNECKPLSANDGLVVADILEKGLWNTEGTAECMSNIELVINGVTYKYHSDCGTFNDKVNQQYLSLDDSTKGTINRILTEYVSLAATENTG